MDSWAKLSREAERYKKEYPVGSRIVLLSMGDDPRPIPDNTRGTVKVVDDIGQIHCDFDNGRHLAIVPGEDSFRLLTEKELDEEFGVEVTSYVKSVDSLIGDATSRSKENNGSKVSEVELEKE